MLPLKGLSVRTLLLGCPSGRHAFGSVLLVGRAALYWLTCLTVAFKGRKAPGVDFNGALPVFLDVLPDDLSLVTCVTSGEVP